MEPTGSALFASGTTTFQDEAGHERHPGKCLPPSITVQGVRSRRRAGLKSPAHSTLLPAVVRSSSLTTSCPAHLQTLGHTLSVYSFIQLIVYLFSVLSQSISHSLHLLSVPPFSFRSHSVSLLTFTGGEVETAGVQRLGTGGPGKERQTRGCRAPGLTLTTRLSLVWLSQANCGVGRVGTGRFLQQSSSPPSEKPSPTTRAED